MPVYPPHSAARLAGLLLDVWTRLLSQMQFRAAQGSSGASERVDGAVRECAREVFAELLKAQLAEYAAGAEDEAEADAAAVRPAPPASSSYHTANPHSILRFCKCTSLTLSPILLAQACCRPDLFEFRTPPGASRAPTTMPMALSARASALGACSMPSATPEGSRAKCVAAYAVRLVVQEAAEEWEALSLDQAAALARSCLPSSLHALHTALSSTAASLLASAGSGGSSATVVALEQLWWLLRVAAAVAADDAAGETPLIPVEVDLLCSSQDPAAELLPEIGKIIFEVRHNPKMHAHCHVPLDTSARLIAPCLPFCTSTLPISNVSSGKVGGTPVLLQIPALVPLQQCIASADDACTQRCADIGCPLPCMHMRPSPSCKILGRITGGHATTPLMPIRNLAS